MENDHILSVEDTSAIRDWVVTGIVSRFATFDERMMEAYTRVAANRMLAQAEADTLLARTLKRVMDVLSQDVGRDLASIARVSRDALISEDGVRRWIGDTHKAALSTFHVVSSDYKNGKASSFDLFLVQVALAGIAKARGLLGIPVEKSQVRKGLNTRLFEPVDFPHQNIRTAIVEAAFDRNPAAVKLLRNRTGTDDDKDGQLTLIVATLDGDDETMLDQLAALAGRICATDRASKRIRWREMADRLTASLSPNRQSSRLAKRE